MIHENQRARNRPTHTHTHSNTCWHFVCVFTSIAPDSFDWFYSTSSWTSSSSSLLLSCRIVSWFCCYSILFLESNQLNVDLLLSFICLPVTIAAHYCHVYVYMSYFATICKRHISRLISKSISQAKDSVIVITAISISFSCYFLSNDLSKFQAELLLSCRHRFAFISHIHIRFSLVFILALHFTFACIRVFVNICLSLYVSYTLPSRMPNGKDNINTHGTFPL